MQLWITCDTQLEFPLYILLGANSCAGKLVRFVIYFFILVPLDCGCSSEIFSRQR